MKPFHYHEDPMYAAAAAILASQTVAEEAAYKILSESNAYLNKLKKLNPGWNPKDAKGDFQNEYDPDDAEDAKDHADYLKSADKFLDDISSFKPGVKIGDWVEIYIKNSPVKSKIGIGKIIAEKTLKGHDYGYMGYKGPSNIPGWQVKAFVEDVNGDYEDKQANDYVMFNGKTYMNIGSGMFYIQHEENQKNTFRKLPKQNLKVVDIKEDVELEEGVEQIASAVEDLKKGDKTNFGVVTDIGSNSISFKAKDLPVTKIAFNQRKMGSKDFVLDKLVKLKEDVSLEEANYTTTKISDDDYEIDVHTKPRYDRSWQDDAKNVNDVRPFVKTIIADIQKFNSDFEFATFLEALIKQIKKESADSDHASYTIEALKDLNKALGKATVNFVANSDDAEPNYDIKPHIVKIIAKIDKVGVGYQYAVLLNALVKHLKTLSSESKAYKQLYKEIDKAVSLFNKELLEDAAIEEGIELDESIKTRIADLLLNLSGSDMSDMIKVAADTFKKNAIELSHSVAADKKDEYKKAIENMHAELLHSKTLTDFEKNGKKLAVQMKSFKEDVSLEEAAVEDLEEGNGSYGMGTATITAPGNKLHGKQVSVFHKFDDGRLNVQYAKSDKKGDVLNLTLNKGQYKLDESVELEEDAQQAKAVYDKLAEKSKIADAAHKTFYDKMVAKYKIKNDGKYIKDTLSDVDRAEYQRVIDARTKAEKAKANAYEKYAVMAKIGSR